MNLNRQLGRCVDENTCDYEWKTTLEMIKDYNKNKALNNELTPRVLTHWIHLVVFGLIFVFSFIAAICTKTISRVFNLLTVLLCALPWLVYMVVATVLGVPVAILIKHATNNGILTKIFYKAK